METNIGNTWIKVHRKLLQWEWHECPTTLSLWLHLLLLANYQTKQWMGITIHRGQLVTGLMSLSHFTGLSIKQVRTSLRRLQEGNQIVIERAKGRTLLTICKYDVYQGDGCDKGQEKGNEWAAQGQEKGNPRATTKESKERKETKEIKKSAVADKKAAAAVEEKREVVEASSPPESAENSENSKNSKSAKSAEDSQGSQGAQGHGLVSGEGAASAAEVIRQFNQTMAAAGAAIPRSCGCSDRRWHTIHARVAEHGTHGVLQMFDKAAASHFLNGENNRRWTATFDWLMAPSNFIKVLEGNYDNLLNNPQNNNPHDDTHPHLDAQRQFGHEELPDSNPLSRAKVYVARCPG